MLCFFAKSSMDPISAFLVPVVTPKNRLMELMELMVFVGGPRIFFSGSVSAVQQPSPRFTNRLRRSPTVTAVYPITTLP